MAERPHDPALAAPTDPHTAPPRDEGKRLIHVGIASFIAACIGMGAIAAQCSSPAKDQPRNAVAEIARAESTGTFHVTLDARDSSRWIGYDLGAGRPVASGERSDLGVRRYVMRAPGGAVDLGNVPLEDAKVPADAKWIPDSVEQGELVNPVLARWYEYSYWSHELRPKGRTFAVRLVSTSGIAYLRVESYGCEPKGAGCLAFRYRLVLGGSDEK